MKILVTGATGFIGGHLIKALSADGHKVIGAARGDMQQSRIGLRYGWMPVDFNRAGKIDDWLNRLQGKDIDVVINAAGILRQTAEQRFSNVHDQAPRALFEAARRCGVQQIIQISALGAAEGCSKYFSSKRNADDSLRKTPLQWTILRPSVIYGEQGASTKLFKRLAMLPLVPLFEQGRQMIQPLHVRELGQIVLQLVNHPPEENKVVNVVGDEAISFREYLSCIRRAAGLNKPHFVSVPSQIVSMAAWLGDALQIPALSRESVSMLRQNSTSNPQSTAQLLGHKPMRVEKFFSL